MSTTTTAQAMTAKQAAYIASLARRIDGYDTSIVRDVQKARFGQLSKAQASALIERLVAAR